MNQAIRERKLFRSGNTEVMRCAYRWQRDTPRTLELIHVYLHSNRIATIRRSESGTTIQLFDGGWQTATTKSRLNAIAREFGVCGVYQKNFEWFFDDGEPFNDMRVQVAA
jgi:hypothetical protein